MVSEEEWRATDYFENFHCKGGSCRNSRCMDLLQDRNKPLPRRMAEICAYIMKESMEIPAGSEENALLALLKILKDAQEESSSMQRFGAAAFDRYCGEDALEKYQSDAAAFEARFPSWESWFENLLANHFFYACVPCVDARIPEARAAHGLCLLYGLMRVLCAAHTVAHPAQEDLADVLAGILRFVEHSPFYYNAQIMLQRPAQLLSL